MAPLVDRTAPLVNKKGDPGARLAETLLNGAAGCRLPVIAPNAFRNSSARVGTSDHSVVIEPMIDALLIWQTSQLGIVGERRAIADEGRWHGLTHPHPRR